MAPTSIVTLSGGRTILRSAEAPGPDVAIPPAKAAAIALSGSFFDGFRVRRAVIHWIVYRQRAEIGRFGEYSQPLKSASRVAAFTGSQPEGLGLFQTLSNIWARPAIYTRVTSDATQNSLPGCSAFVQGSMVANAQYPGRKLGATDHRLLQPSNASSPECAGTTPNPYGDRPAVLTLGKARYWDVRRPATAFRHGWKWNLIKIFPPTSTSFQTGTQFRGAYPNPYSPYLGFQQRQPLTEFQRVVAGSVGAVLPIFGANLFSSNAAQFAPIDRTPVTSDYVVGPAINC